jgi:hypothetical protein
MDTKDIHEATFEVVPEGDGFGVRRVGEPQSISYHDTREQAEAAAAAQSGQGQEVDARKDIFSGDGPAAETPKRTFTAAALFAIAVVLLIVVISLIVALG